MQPVRSVAAGAATPRNRVSPRAAFRHVAKINLARIGDFNRPQWAFVQRVARAAITDAARQNTGPQHSEKPNYGRAQAAFDSEFARWLGLIEAAQNDMSLSAEQRAAAVVALRERQQIAANGARKRVMDEEKQTAKAARRAARTLTARPSLRPR